MLLLLPRKQGYQALNDLSRDITFTPISTILASLKETELELAMPKFTIESKTDLKPYLIKVDLTDHYSIYIKSSQIDLICFICYMIELFSLFIAWIK